MKDKHHLFYTKDVHYCGLRLNVFFLKTLKEKLMSIHKKKSIFRYFCVFLHISPVCRSSYIFLDVCIMLPFIPLSLSDRPSAMRESASGRNSPLAVSMTTSQSSTPAKTPNPPGRLEVCVCVCNDVSKECFFYSRK